MDTAEGIIDTVLRAVGGTPAEASGGTPGRQPHVDPLRLLAALEMATRKAVDDAAASVGNSPVRAAALAHLSERIYRTGSYAQVLAAGSCVDTEAHTLTEAPLAALNQLLADPGDFAAGAANLPADQVTGPDRKPLHHDPAEFLKSQLHLGYFQARHRITTNQRLMDHRGPDGTALPPRFPHLAAVLTGGTADPRLLANAAAKLEALQPDLDALPDPKAARELLEERVAQTSQTGDEATLGKFLKQAAIELEATVVEREEAETARYMGLRFQGHKPKGYVWELTTDAEGHEMLSTLADDLNNPRTSAGSPAISAIGNPVQSPEDTSAGYEAPPIPDWAVSPDTPPEQRPRAGFTDPRIEADGIDFGFPGVQYPGESVSEANARRRAQRLSQALMDAIRIWQDPAAPAGPDMPMASRIELLVMIDYASLTGAVEKPGLTPHGEYVSAAAARRMACNGGILPLVMGGKGQPLDLGRRRRFFTKGQKRAIAARDRGCANPGCSMPTHRCEVHHVVPFSLGGKTDVSQGLLLCVRCHTALHAGHFTIRVLDGIPQVVLPKSRDPLQRPRRNWVFHPEAAAA
ncbi:HNH endonuclease [Paeniglutamicibacter sp. ABSL32-1]|uniref:HNH endonuclease signature motif containing protein n=1 Tax=Paeniglutamicibacter quisquiliarum TaxID=2849498 RepID=UPI001C2D8DAD|nr:HNH endonuclease signature motif containing protein [Paeniglutamicibacter quisquiliarum]MBV1778621.1 HNH endonuclease [Paeniglutamicibacter quisquiliarum]